MGTRSVSAISIDGEIVLSQTKQLDGYPMGLGMEIVNEIKSHWTKDSVVSAMLRVKQVDDISKCKTEEDVDNLLSQSNYLNHIGLQRALEKLRENPNETYRMSVNNILFGQDGLFCEWGYVVDIDRFILEIYKGGNKTKPVQEGFFAGDGYISSSGEDRWYPIVKVAEIDLNQSFSDIEDQLEAIYPEEFSGI